MTKSMKYIVVESRVLSVLILGCDNTQRDCMQSHIKLHQVPFPCVYTME